MERYKKKFEEADDIFMQYEDTNLSGPSCEMAIDNLIEEFEGFLIKDSLSSRDKIELKREIKKLWFNKIKEW